MVMYKNVLLPYESDKKEKRTNSIHDKHPLFCSDKENSQRGKKKPVNGYEYPHRRST